VIDLRIMMCHSMISCSLQEIYTMFGFMNIVQGLADIFVLSKLEELKLYIRFCSVIAIFVRIVFDYYDNAWFKQYFILSKHFIHSSIVHIHNGGRTL
jgi:hypothetical protein